MMLISRNVKALLSRSQGLEQNIPLSKGLYPISKGLDTNSDKTQGLHLESKGIDLLF